MKNFFEQIDSAIQKAEKPPPLIIGEKTKKFLIKKYSKKVVDAAIRAKKIIMFK